MRDDLIDYQPVCKYVWIVGLIKGGDVASQRFRKVWWRSGDKDNAVTPTYESCNPSNPGLMDKIESLIGRVCLMYIDKTLILLRIKVCAAGV
jgi:hypothetical protein